MLYTGAIYLYQLGIQVAALYQPKARQFIVGRRQPVTRFDDQRPVLWFHAASLGEFEQGRPVMEACKQAFPNARLVVTFFSPSGYLQQQEFALADAIYYLPMDIPHKVTAWIDAIRPTMAIFIKYDIWPNLLRACRKQGVITLLIAARFYPKQPYFSWWGTFFRRALTHFDHIIVQEERVSAPLLASIGLQKYSYAPDTRIDRMVAVRDAPWAHPLLDQLTDRPVIVAGSIWLKDLQLLKQAIARYSSVYWLLAPHDINAANLQQLSAALDMPAHYLSKDTTLTHSIIWIDTMGMLARSYRYGNAAYVGGGFGRGIHNILEPTAYGLPTAFGPNHHTFHEAQALLDGGAARCVTTPQQVSAWVDMVLQDNGAYGNACKAATAYIDANTGGTALIMEQVRRLWPAD